MIQNGSQESPKASVMGTSQIHLDTWARSKRACVFRRRTLAQGLRCPVRLCEAVILPVRAGPGEVVAAASAATVKGTF